MSVYKVDLYPAANDDLVQIKKARRDVWADLIMLIGEVLTDPEVNAQLRQEVQGYAGPGFNVLKFERLQRTEGQNVWRLKPLPDEALWSAPKDIAGYRIFYALDHERQVLWILAVAKREVGEDDTYGPEHPVAKRVCRAYDRLGLKRLSVYVTSGH